MSITRRLAPAVAATAVLGLAACEGGRTTDIPIDPTAGSGGLGGTDAGGRLTDIPGIGLGDDPQGDALTPVNRFLWRASLDTLAFLPLASTDPFTGVIATDWGASPEAPTERFKVTAYVVDPTLSANSLRVAVFREIRSPEGAWVTAPVSGVTARRLEDAILVRARQLRIEERQAQG